MKWVSHINAGDGYGLKDAGIGRLIGRQVQLLAPTVLFLELAPVKPRGLLSFSAPCDRKLDRVFCVRHTISDLARRASKPTPPESLMRYQVMRSVTDNHFGERA